MATVLVHGPYLVRSASVSKSTLALRGDSVEKTTLEIFAPHSVREITWNGKEVKTSRTSYGSLKATLAAPPTIKLPALTSWRSNDSLPERLPSYDDSGPAWIGKLNLIDQT
jgi:beta-galactosidase